jgi:Tol biopolymer transport system component
MVLVVAVAAVWFSWSLKTEEPAPIGIPMQLTHGEAWEGEPAISPDGTRVAYVSNESGNDEIYVTDVVGGNTRRLTENSDLDFSPTWFPDGESIAYVTEHEGLRSVWKVSPQGGHATLLMDNAESPSISPDGTTIAFCRAGNTGPLRMWVAPLAAPSDAVMLTTMEHGLWDHVEPAWSPDGGALCYSTFSGIWTVQVGAGEPRQVTATVAATGQSVWSSDGRYIYFDSQREGAVALYRVRSTGGAPQPMAQGVGLQLEPAVSLDGSRLVCATGGEGAGAVLLDLVTGQQTAIGRLRLSLMASISPDESSIVFVSRRWDGRGELAEQLLEGGVPSGPPRRLTNQEGNASHPAHSPDGRWVAYYLIEEGRRDIWVVPAAGGEPIQLTDDAAQDIHPAWSPDGSVLAFVSDKEGSNDLWLAPVSDGERSGEPLRVTNGSPAAVFPAWSPDGSHIAFIGFDGVASEIWVVSSDGAAAPRRLTDGVDATRIRWDPATGSILAAATCGERHRRLWAVSPQTGEAEVFEPEIIFGTKRAYGLFDVSRTGRLLVFSRERLEGDVWVSEGPPGTF